MHLAAESHMDCGIDCPADLIHTNAVIDAGFAVLTMSCTGQAAHFQRHQPLHAEADHLAQPVGAGGR
mgnify:CR=1 FL=1